MIHASALPMKGASCCNRSMLQGQELVAALHSAIELKSRQSAEKFGPTALGRALGMTQPSASDLLKHGRLAKSKYWKLIETFADVVGPDRWGLPFNGAEFELLRAFRELPASKQAKLLADVQRVAQTIQSLEIDAEEAAAATPLRKQNRAH